MPFDATDFDPPPPAVRKPGRGEKAILIAVGVVAVLLLALPVPFSALADIAHYILARR